MEKLLELDRELFLELNSFHNPWLDQVMLFLSSTAAWSPLYLFLLYLIVRYFKRETWMVLVSVALVITLADQVTSTLMKPFFERLRPTHDPGLQALVHTVDNYRGAKFGFASSHAANTFGIAMLMWLLLKPYRPWIALLFLWALTVGFTRIYLGVHFPGDILAGHVVGFLSALAVFYLFLFLKKYMDERNTLQPGD